MVVARSREPLILDFPPTPSVVADARRATADALASWGLGSLADDLGTAVSELVTNAVLHAGTEILVVLRPLGTGVRLEVSDAAPHLLPREVVQPPIDWFAGVDDDWDPLEAETMTGRGLLLVSTLADRWGVDQGELTKTVWAEFATGAPHDATAARTTSGRAPRPVPEAGVPIRLLGVPVRLALKTFTNVDDLVRELRVSEPTHGEVARLARVLLDDTRRAQGETFLEDARAAAQRGERLLDAEVRSSPAEAASVREVYDVIKRLGELAAEGVLLAAPPGEELQGFRHWCVQETERQLAGWEPTPCPFPVTAEDDPVVAEATRQALARLVTPPADAATLLTRLSRTSAALVVSADLQSAVELVLAAAADELGASSASLCLVSADAITMELAATTRAAEVTRERWKRFSVSEDVPAVEALRTRAPVLLQTIHELHTRFPAIVDVPLGEGGAMAFLPVGADAVLIVGFPSERLFDEVDRAFLGALASVTAQAVTRLRAEVLAEANVETEARFRTMADAAPVLMWMADVDGQADWFNRGWLDFRGRMLEEEVGEGWKEGVHPEDLDRLVEVYLGALARRDLYEHDYRLRRADGTYRWIFDRGVPRHLPDGAFAGYVGSCVDIDDRKAAEDEARRAHEQLSFLTAVTDGVTASLDAIEVLQVVLRLSVPALADVAFAYLHDGDVLQRVAVEAGDHTGFEAWEAADAVPVDGPKDVSVAFLTGRVQRTTFDDESLAGAPPALRAAIRNGGLDRGVAVPISSPRGDRLGVLGFAVSAADRAHSLDDLGLVHELAARVGVAVENALLYQWQHTLAEQLQQAVLPDALPDVPGVVVDACYRPASMGAEVGGDWYDAFVLRDGRVGLAVGDVSGHGLEAASAMSRLRNALRAYALGGDPPASVLSCLCDFHDDSEVFATVLYGILHPGSGELRWVNAGHIAPLLRRGESVRRLDAAVGPPIGVDPSYRYEENVVSLAEGDALLACTDGLVERRGEHLDIGMADLARAFAVAGPIQGIADSVVDAVLGVRGHDDDVCVLAVERRR